MLKTKRRIKDLCELYQGEYVEGKWGKGPYMVLDYKNHELVFDYYVVSAGQSFYTYTRMRTAFKTHKPFNMKTRKLTWLSKFLGNRGIQFQHDHLDERYLIRGSDEALIDQLLRQGHMASKFDFKKYFTFEITNKNTMGLKCEPGELGVIFYTSSLMKDPDEIEKIINLFKGTLDALYDLNIPLDLKASTELYQRKT
jgi:hypothetical protein